MITKICGCGKEFKTYPCLANRIKNCSKECRTKYRKRKWSDKRIKLVCKCGKEFLVYPYRLSGRKGDGRARFCSTQCSGKYGNWFGKNIGKKIPKGSLAKMGDKNPIRIHGIQPEHLKKLQEGAKKYQDSIRVSKEHKRIVKKILDYKRKATIKGQFTPEEWIKLKEKYHFICPACGKKENEMKWNKLTVDHIIPLSKDGTNTIENIQPLCLSCNCKKHNNHSKKYEII